MACSEQDGEEMLLQVLQVPKKGEVLANARPASELNSRQRPPGGGRAKRRKVPVQNLDLLDIARPNDLTQQRVGEGFLTVGPSYRPTSTLRHARSSFTNQARYGRCP